MLTALQPYSVVFVVIGALFLVVGLVLELRQRGNTPQQPMISVQVGTASPTSPAQPPSQQPNQHVPVVSLIPAAIQTPPSSPQVNPSPQNTGVTLTGLPTIQVGDTRLERLEKLVQLRAQNLITQEDYEQLKARVLQEL
jgi:hypothetical protein